MAGALNPADSARLEPAVAMLGAGATGRAIAALRDLIGERPDMAAAHQLLAGALEASGDGVGAEAAWRAALALDPSLAAAAVRLAVRLTARRRPGEAIDILAPFVASAAADIDLLTAYGAALKLEGRHEDAADAYRRAAEIAPASGVAEHNLAGALGDAHRFAESEAATRRAFAKGLDAPETWLVRGRALQGLYEFEEAEEAFRQAIRRRPAYASAHGDLAQLIWMRTENLGEACEALDAALSANPSDAPLALAKAKLLEYTGDKGEAYGALSGPLARGGADPELLVTAALLSMADNPGLALAHAEEAAAVAPGSGPVNAALCQANLALGRAEVAAGIAEGLCRDWPLDQYPVALAATAYRMLGDPRYGALYDYDRLVRVQTIDTPAGWSTLNDYLGELATRLRALQKLRGHPIGQSLRHGAQTGQSLERSNDPVIAAFFTAIDAPIRAYIDVLRGHDDVLGRRVGKGYRFSGAWSVLLRPGGYHVNHLHPMGWISSACHIALPAAVERGHEGWLKFGEPDVRTDPPLGPEHFVKPRAGDLVLFPSYMWHGTVPFGGEEPRLAAAFDVLPE
jgi:tetratricopeptide (TPR) repeat protein